MEVHKAFTAEVTLRSLVLGGLKQEEETTNTKPTALKKYAGRLATWHLVDRKTSGLGGFLTSELSTKCHSPRHRRAPIFTQAQEHKKFHRKAFQSTYQAR